MARHRAAVPADGEPGLGSSLKRGTLERSSVPRIASLVDLEPLLELRRQFCASERLPWDEAITRRALGEILADSSAGRVWIVQQSGEPAGYAVLTRGFSLEFEGRDGFLDELYVLPAYRDRGLGRALLAAVEAGCRELGVRALHLEVDRDQARVQELYRRGGFRDHDRYLMTKRIHDGADTGAAPKRGDMDTSSSTARTRAALRTRRRIVDVSHTVEHGMITYPGMPVPELTDFLSREASRARYAPGTEFHIGRITMVANTGTYVDAPSHRFEGAPDLSGLDLERLADMEGVVVRRPHAGDRAIGPDAFGDVEVEGRAVLVQTDWDLRWRTDGYGSGHPFLTEAAARLLADRGAALVGIDSLNIDDTDDARRPVHTTLLAAGIPVVEHLCGLRELPDRGFRFFAVPVKVRGMGSFPVRAFAIVDTVGDRRDVTGD